MSTAESAARVRDFQPGSCTSGQRDVNTDATEVPTGIANPVSVAL